MKNRIKYGILLMAIATTGILSSASSAQPFEITFSTIDCGGGFCANGPFQLNGGIGQHDAGQELVGAAFTLTGGFWAASTDQVILGDVNGDGELNLLDVAPFVEAITSGVYSPEADLNGDGVVDLLDVQLFIDLLTG